MRSQELILQKATYIMLKCNKVISIIVRRQKYPLINLLCPFIMEVVASRITENGEIKDIRIKKKESNLHYSQMKYIHI